MFEINIVADLESIHSSFDWELIIATSMSFHFSGDNLKIFFIVLIFMCGWLGVLSPRCFDPFGKTISFGNLFSSGVLMSAALVHLLGDATSDLDSAPLPKTASGDAYPWGFLVCAISFYFLFIVERLFIGMYMDNIISKKEKENKKKEILNERAHMRDSEILDSNKNKNKNKNENTKKTNGKKVKNNQNQNNKHNKSHNSRININNNDNNNSSYDDDNKVEYDTSNDNITKLYLNNNNDTDDNDDNIKTTSKKSFESNATNNTSLLGVNANAINNNKSGTAYEALLSPNEQDLNDDLTQRNSMDSPQMNIKIEKTKPKNTNKNGKKRKHSSHSSSESSSSSDDTDNKGLHMHTHMHTEGPLPHVDDMEIVDLLLSKQYLSAIVLLVGLGIHSFFAGLALGATSSLNVAVTLGIAIVCHKYLAAFALGVPLYKSQQSLCYSVMIATIFGSFTPAGIALGWILENALAGWVTDLLVCIAAGTFLYVSIIEVLIPEFSTEKQMETHVLKENERIKQLRESQFSPFPQPLPFTAYSAPNSPQNKKSRKQQQQFNNSLTSNTTANTANTANTSGINTRTIVAVKRGDNISKTPASARAPISTITEGMKNQQDNVVVDNIQQYEYSSNIAQYGTPNNMSGMGAPGTPLLGSAISMTPTFMLETLKQQSHRQDCLKMTFVITGFAIMSTLAIWV